VKAKKAKSEVKEAASIIYTATLPVPLYPEVLRHCGRSQGLLVSVEPAEECQIAQIVNQLGVRRIVLPQDLDLSGYIGQRIVMLRIDDKYYVRKADESLAPTSSLSTAARDEIRATA
jgi:hypothetical protein